MELALAESANQVPTQDEQTSGSCTFLDIAKSEEY